MLTHTRSDSAPGYASAGPKRTCGRGMDTDVSGGTARLPSRAGIGAVHLSAAPPARGVHALSDDPTSHGQSVDTRDGPAAIGSGIARRAEQGYGRFS